MTGGISSNHGTEGGGSTGSHGHGETGGITSVPEGGIGLPGGSRRI